MPAAVISAAPRGVGAASPGDTRYTSPPSAAPNPAQPVAANRSPACHPAANIVSCTAPNRISAPVAALTVRYANEKHATYTNSIAAAGQSAGGAGRRAPARATIARISAPDTRRRLPKLAASIRPACSASRHSSEFDANASIAIDVSAATRMPGRTCSANVEASGRIAGLTRGWQRSARPRRTTRCQAAR